MQITGTQTEVEMLRGEPVFAADGEKVGDVEKILFDKATGKPEWLAIKSGLLGLKKSRLAPFQGAQRRDDGVLVRYSVSQIEAAPELEGDEISQELERRLASHFGLEYSERRSPTGLAGGQRRDPAGQGSSRSQSSRQRSKARASSRRSGARPRSEGPTRDELYEEAKRRGIEGRSKMNKAQLARALGRASTQSRGRSRGGGGKANPFEVQKFLEAVGYPASKGELVREAKEQGAHASVRTTLERLPDEKFDTPADLSKAISALS
jgi:sporulation protein YlmC with PRC-barrel domain